jgi:hypothetical protein
MLAMMIGVAQTVTTDIKKSNSYSQELDLDFYSSRSSKTVSGLSRDQRLLRSKFDTQARQ